MLKMQIASLEVYRDEALLFLINIKSHFAEMSNCARCKELAAEAGKSILNILRNSQIDVSGLKFEGQPSAQDKKNGIMFKSLSRTEMPS